VSAPVVPSKVQAAEYFAIDFNLGATGSKDRRPFVRLINMTHHDVPFVVSLLWLAALSGGLIFVLFE